MVVYLGQLHFALDLQHHHLLRPSHPRLHPILPNQQLKLHHILSPPRSRRPDRQRPLRLVHWSRTQPAHFHPLHRHRRHQILHGNAARHAWLAHPRPRLLIPPIPQLRLHHR